ncbi:succinate-semialdehyde dehydrogenase/glutarate-semialdehyde dehydrogenase [Arthrobacter oryzae]|nr:succinate-semialdehyde dehydrogenase/glutarate-semialdehyde dehydrogenase [Arthrobacter oryzae]
MGSALPQALILATSPVLLNERKKLTVPTLTEPALLNRVPTGLLIGGQWREASDGGTFEVHDPATGEVIVTLASATSDDAVAALDAADAAQASWARTAPRVRAEILRRAFDLVTERAEDFALLMTLEMGKPLAESRGEVTYGAEFLRWFSEETVRDYGRYLTTPEGRTRSWSSTNPSGPACSSRRGTSRWRWPPARSPTRSPLAAPWSSSPQSSPR